MLLVAIFRLTNNYSTIVGFVHNMSQRGAKHLFVYNHPISNIYKREWKNRLIENNQKYW